MMQLALILKIIASKQTNNQTQFVFLPENHTLFFFNFQSSFT